MKKISFIVGEDPFERHFVAGPTACGKTTYLMGVAARYGYEYVSDEIIAWKESPMTCQEYLEGLKRSLDRQVNGIVFDCCRLEEHLVDFNTYKWNIPVWYMVQTNRQGKVNYEKDWIKRNLKQIFITDIKEDNDMQTEHALNFLTDLAKYVGQPIVEDTNE